MTDTARQYGTSPARLPLSGCVHPNERGLRRVQVDKVTGCWVWCGPRRNGYACLRYDGRSRAIHRLLYEVLVESIPVGMQIDHLCRNPLCVNPAHMEPVIAAINVYRGAATKLTLLEVKEMRRLYRECGLRSKALAERFGVSPATVHRVVNYKSFTRVPDGRK